MHPIKINLFTLCCLTIAALAGGCALPGSRYYPVIDNAPRHSSLGFSISPPPGEGWFERHEEDSLFYLKKTRPRLYSIYTKATEIHFDKAFRLPEDFHRYVKNRKSFRQSPEGYRQVEFRYKDIEELSPFCVRYSNKFEDHGRKTTNDQGFFRVRKTGILCMHPGSPQDGIDMYYLERSLSSSAEPSFQKEGEQFLSSLRFYPVVK